VKQRRLSSAPKDLAAPSSWPVAALARTWRGETHSTAVRVILMSWRLRGSHLREEPTALSC